MVNVSVHDFAMLADSPDKEKDKITVWSFLLM
jgi:hypothetical protein